MKNQNFFDNYKLVIIDLIKKINTKDLKQAFIEINLTSKRKGKVIVFGNGANTSTSSHFATDMTKNGKIRTISLNDPNLITCFSNDYGFERWIEKAIEYYADKNDLVILLSASGNSKNLVNAAKYCRRNNIKTLSITGFNKKNKLQKLTNKKIFIDSKGYNLIEIIQNIILLSLVDKKIGKTIYSSNL